MEALVLLIEQKIKNYNDQLLELAKIGNESIFFQVHSKLINCFSDYEIDVIQICTITQSDSLLWHSIRPYRLTGSSIGPILTWNGRNYQYGSRFLYNHVNPTPQYITDMNNNPYVQYGKRMEPVARDIFNKKNSDLLSVQDSGIIILKQYPWIAVSPDGIGRYLHSETIDFTIEIKCPSSGVNPAERLLDKMHLLPLTLPSRIYEQRKALFLDKIGSRESNHNNGDAFVDKSHYYYVQCLFQMYAVHVSHCYFIVLIKEDTIYTIKFTFDECYFQSIMVRLETLYLNNFLPVLWSEYKKKATQNDNGSSDIIKFNACEKVVAKKRKFYFQ